MASSANSAQAASDECKTEGKGDKANGVTIDPAIKELCSTDEIEALYKKLSIDEVSSCLTYVCYWLWSCTSIVVHTNFGFFLPKLFQLLQSTLSISVMNNSACSPLTRLFSSPPPPPEQVLQTSHSP